jgi:1-deoxy-D-xylulose-5-phosphate reductoisomerase
MIRPKRISILGSTGSIGRSTLDVVRLSKGLYEVVGLAAGQNIQLLLEQICEFKPRVVAVMTQEAAEELKMRLKALNVAFNGRVLYGKDGYVEVATLRLADIVVSAMVGAAGIVPTVAAIEAGKDIALANKEVLVAAGPLVRSLADKKRVNILPVDSEHSAIFQCLAGHRRREVSRILLTASGGPFRLKQEGFEAITPEEAVKHPNWSMGQKISVDSSTLMNKGFEVIEAKWLFEVEAEKIEVLIHPQSIVHSMVEFWDGSILAHLGIADMRIPISYALSWPERMPLDLPRLDLTAVSSLSFHAPDFERFPCLLLAYEALRRGGTATTALNAANEVAVEAFLQHRLAFTDIVEVVRRVLADFTHQEITSLEDVLSADALARVKAHRAVDALASA